MEVNKHINFLKRRGFLIKESTQMDIDFFKDNETVDPKSKKEKSKIDLDTEVDLGVNKIDTSVVDSNNIINIRGLCNRAKQQDIKESGSNIYCRLLSEIEKNNLDYDRITRNLDVIYHFFRPNNNNRRKFHGLINHILDDGGYMEMNTINLLADYLKKIDTNRDQKTMDAINRLKSEPEQIQTSDELEELLKKVKTTEYSKYEKSFVGKYFQPARSGPIEINGMMVNKKIGLNLPYRNSGDETFTNLLQTHIEQGSSGIDRMKMVYSLFNNITGMTDLNTLIKADLVCTNSLVDENGDVIIPSGNYVEVKKLDLKGDSYLSEFFAIYKDSNIGEFANKADYYDLYNQTIDILFGLVRTSLWGRDVLEAISKQFAGVIYKDGDMDRFIPSADIELYWSNAGQPKCENQRRLAIRYRVKSGKRSSYIYKHDGTMLHDFVNVSGSKKIMCGSESGVMYPKRIIESTVTNKLGKMIRTKGGIKKLYEDFDWAIQQAELTPSNPRIEALINHFTKATDVIGPNFNEVGDTYGGAILYKLENDEEWVVGTEKEMDEGLREYYYSYLDEVGVDDLHLDVTDFLDISDYWIENFISEEASYYVDNLDDKEILEMAGHLNLYEDLINRYHTLEDLINELQTTINLIPLSNNQQTFLNKKKNELTKLIHEHDSIEGEKNELINNCRDIVMNGEIESLTICMEDPYICVIDKGLVSNVSETIAYFGWGLDTNAIVDYLVINDGGYESLAAYDGKVYYEYVDGVTYVLMRF